MKKSAYIFLAAAALFAAASCESGIQPDDEKPVDDGILCFLPTLSGGSVTKSNGNNGVSCHAELDSASDGIADQARNDARHAGPDPASQTKAAELVSADGSIAVPLICEVVEGIAGQARNDVNGARNDVNGARNNDGRHAELDSASDPSRHAELDLASDSSRHAELDSASDSSRHAELDSASDSSRHAELDSASPLTRGALLNTTSDWKDLGTYVSKFYVAAWKGSTSFVPAYKEVTKATPLWKTTDTYRWGATEEATFYAYANLPTSGATVSAISGAQLLTYTVPTASSAQQDILMGYYSGYSKFSSINNGAFHKGGVAEIKFYHPLTSVRFKKGTFEGYAADKVKIKSISIIGVYTSGIATMTSTTMGKTDPGDKFTWNLLTTATQKVTMSPASGTYLTVDDDNFIGDAFLLIPQAMTASNLVKITIKVDLDGTEKDFEAKLNSNTWAAGKTNVYTLGYDDPNT